MFHSQTHYSLIRKKAGIANGKGGLLAYALGTHGFLYLTRRNWIKVIFLILSQEDSAVLGLNLTS